MAQSQYSLAWDQYKVNICNGLSSLQQNEELVDMTIAADGHYVKVHKVIVALTSPFIKELIASADCPHPVVFLNKISYSTLCSILEYMYTGEVLVSVENLEEFIEAGKNLHIKGLEEMKCNQSVYKSQTSYPNFDSTLDERNEQVCYFEVETQNDEEDRSDVEFGDDKLTECNQTALLIENDYDDMVVEEVDRYATEENQHDFTEVDLSNLNTDANSVRVMQYTVSNQGSLQMILNRYLYYLKHTNKNNSRQWRCVDYVTNLKCPAHVVSLGDMVVQRIAAHTHPFHDKKILKKVKAGAVFSAIQEAEKQGTSKRKKLEEASEMPGVETE